MITPKLSGRILENLIFFIFAILCLVSWYFYKPQITGFWNSGVNKIVELSTSLFSSKKDTELVNTVPPQNNTVIPPYNKTISVKDCGTTNSPDLKNKNTYENNAVLNCLGVSALSCGNAKAVFANDLFPNMIQIVGSEGADQNVCNFKLSYGADSTLVDIDGNKLAGQYISCPLSIVKAIDETKTPTLFTAASIDNLNKYASQIYFYGTLGVFMENNMDKNRIQALGCSGDYIDSMIASYRKMQSN
ncbi:MAG: hypothetical protein WC735_04355 [Candidatus Paceibacterota bacterium]|jgi:hypothetical protein